MTVFYPFQNPKNMSSLFMAQITELGLNRDDADVTLNCQGEEIKAHSLILGIRCVNSTKVIKTDN